MVPIIDTSEGKPESEAVALAGVFTETDGIFTVPVEIDGAGEPAQADPALKSTFKQGKALNTLVVLDEAHRLAPREKQENPEFELVKSTLKDAVRTTRKYGLGWMFVSQTLSSLDREIINQIRVYIFGFGLAYGIELQALRDIIGGNEEAIRLYQLFKDPQSTPRQKEYSFMTIGPISPLSFSGIPLFFQALQYPDKFVEANDSGLKQG